MGNKKALLLINKYVNVMGASVKPELLIKKINENFPPSESYKVNERIISLSKKIYYSTHINSSLDCQELLELINVRLEIDKSKPVWVFTISKVGLKYHLKMDEFIIHVKKYYAEKILFENGLI